MRSCTAVPMWPLRVPCFKWHVFGNNCLLSQSGTGEIEQSTASPIDANSLLPTSAEEALADGGTRTRSSVLARYMTKTGEPHMAAAKKVAMENALPSNIHGYADASFADILDTRLRECCLLVLNLVSSTLPCICQPRPRLRVLDICGFVLVCTQAFISF